MDWYCIKSSRFPSLPKHTNKGTTTLHTLITRQYAIFRMREDILKSKIKWQIITTFFHSQVSGLDWTYHHHELSSSSESERGKGGHCLPKLSQKSRNTYDLSTIIPKFFQKSQNIYDLYTIKKTKIISNPLKIFFLYIYIYIYSPPEFNLCICNCFQASKIFNINLIL